ncbi:hypothetical protein HK098_005201 [Nowakowskiella sp. JEL0407]|nr:hypothetical protein HK098_005201 [Nowakowskiella sp. JEL0407]
MTEKHVIQSIKYSRSAEFRYCSNLISQISTKKCKASEKRQLFGPYRLMKTIGKGESGKVKLAYSKSGVVAAIKLIKKDAVANASLPTKVMKEVSLMKKLDHPNVVKLIEVIETEWYIGIVMDYVPSGDLFDFICKGKMKEKDAAKLFAQIVSAVFYLHSQGIAHRDLKLENILMDKKQNILLSDFGFATEFQTDRMLKTSCGSPHYAAPEILFDECYDGELAEVWSCGVILYAMVTGYLPFDDDPRNPDGENITLLYEYIRDEEVHFPDHVSADLQDLLRKMLKTDPDERIKMSEIKSHWYYIYTKPI